MSTMREMIKSKLLSDKSIMNERTYLNGLHDNLIYKIYLAFSNDARNILKSEIEVDNIEIKNYFYNLVKFDKEKYNKERIITNDIIMNLNSKIINVKECNLYSLKKLLVINPNNNKFNENLSENKEKEELDFLENKLIRYGSNNLSPLEDKM